MTTPRYKLGRAFSARRLILLATAGNLAIAALLVGPDSLKASGEDRIQIIRIDSNA